jgi:hypothetical protein
MNDLLELHIPWIVFVYAHPMNFFVLLASGTYHKLSCFFAGAAWLACRQGLQNARR